MDAGLSALLARLGLGRLKATLIDEAITELPLLASMGAEMLQENLAEIGVADADIALLSAELFPQPAGAKGSSAGAAAVARGAEQGSNSGTMTAAEADAAGATHDEETAHAMAEWLLKPYLVTDLAELKKKVRRGHAGPVVGRRAPRGECLRLPVATAV